MSGAFVDYQPALQAVLNADGALVAAVTHPNPAGGANIVAIYGGSLPEKPLITLVDVDRQVPLEAVVVATGGGPKEPGDQGLVIGTPRAKLWAYAPTRARARFLWYQALNVLAPKTRRTGNLYWDCDLAAGPSDGFELETRFPFAGGFLSLTTLRVA